MTIITHFYNEEFLLPYWLDHHKRIFDHGILIDYNSTDSSVDIIKEICPTWEILPSRNSEFSAKACDSEVMDIESQLTGYRIALNVTEFIIGDLNELIKTNREQYLIPALPMVDSLIEEFTDLEFPGESLIGQRTNGINSLDNPDLFHIRKSRSFHRVPFAYSTGRHFDRYTTAECLILWYGYSPFNENLIRRKLQIQTKIPDLDKKMLFGREHIVTRDELIQNFRSMQQYATDLSDLIYPLLRKSYGADN